MKVSISNDFIKDLEKIGDVVLYKSLWRKILDENGEFRSSKDDHRYKGLKEKDLWIRYITQGSKAYRLIYKQIDNKITLYRVGTHSIENNLSAPNFKYEIEYKNVSILGEPDLDLGSLLIHDQRKQITRIFEKMYHVGHKEIFLISPSVDKELLSIHKPFGRFLDKAIEENTMVWLVTKYPDQDLYSFYRQLEARSIFVYFKENLNTKMYIFNIDTDTLYKWNRNDYEDTAIIGSSDFTHSGLGFEDSNTNEEACYKLPHSKFKDALNYANKLRDLSIDFVGYKKYL